MLGAVLRSGRQHRRALPVLEAVSANQQLILQEQKARLSSVCSLPWCKYSYHIPSQATDAMLLNAQWERARTGEVSVHAMVLQTQRAGEQ